MWSAEALRRIQRPRHRHVLADEWTLVAQLTVPHAQARLDRLFEQLVALRRRWKGQPEALGLLADLVVIDQAQFGFELCVDAV